MDKVNDPRFNFDASPTVDELIAQQGKNSIKDPRSLLGDFCPEDEPIERFLSALREWRGVRTTLDLTPEAYHLAKAVACERKHSLAALVSECIVGHTKSKRTNGLDLGVSAAGFPTFDGGVRRTHSDVKALLDELEEVDERQ